MKRLSALISLCAALLMPALALGASETSVRFEYFPITFRTLSASAPNGGVLDSTKFTITGTPTLATIDTSTWIDLSNCAWTFGNQNSPQTGYEMMRIFVWGTTVTSVDSLPIFIDYKVGNAITQGTAVLAVNALSSAAGTVDGLLTTTSMAVSLGTGAGTTAGPPFGATAMRIRLVCDGNSAARIFNCQAVLLMPVYDPPAINRRVEWRTVPLPWAVQRVGYASGQLAPVDSARTLVGIAAATVITSVTDTTAWFDMSNVAWDAGAQTGLATPYGMIRITAAIEGTNTSSDTLFYTPEYAMSGDGTVYNPTTALTLLPSAASTDEAILQNGLNTDSNANIAPTLIPWGVKLMRLKVRGDNNSAALATSVRMFVTLPFYVE